MRDNPANHNRADDRTGPACIASSLRFCGFCNSLTDLWWYCGSREHGRFWGSWGHMYSNEEATNIASSIHRETIFIYPVMNSLKSCDQYNSLMERLVSHVRQASCLIYWTV